MSMREKRKDEDEKGYFDSMVVYGRTILRGLFTALDPTFSVIFPQGPAG
jgi:hypothetical protein